MSPTECEQYLQSGEVRSWPITSSQLTNVTIQGSGEIKTSLIPVDLIFQQFNLSLLLENEKVSAVSSIQSQPGRVVAPVLQPLEAEEEEVQDLLPAPGGEEVEVGEYPAHDV